MSQGPTSGLIISPSVGKVRESILSDGKKKCQNFDDMIYGCCLIYFPRSSGEIMQLLACLHDDFFATSKF